MKIISKITIHPISYFVAIIFFLMGKFKIYISFMIIILIHELGHILASIYFKWKINKVIILPFGCLIKFDEYLNRPIKEEFIISIMGITFQLLFTMKINYNYNIIIIIYNLLPIYPLDGSKILNIFINKISSFKYSLHLTIYISYITLTILFIIIILKKDVISLIIIIPLIIEIIKHGKESNNIINKFYLERYLYNFTFNKRKIIDNISKMKRDYIHIIKNNGKYQTEKNYLRNMFIN